MLDRAHRLTSGREFEATVRRGRRAGSRTLVLHLSLGEERSAPPRVGFVVGKAVGNAVIRNQVKRRLRHIARDRLQSLPGGAVLVVRALPLAGGSEAGALTEDFDGALGRLVRLSDRR
jgi:ribonuclease P protein component